MVVQVTGKNIDIGESLRDHVLSRVDQIVGKYIDGELTGHVRVEKVRNDFVTSCSMQLSWGLNLQSSGQAADPYASADVALERLDKRLRRYKRRLVDRHQGAGHHNLDALPDLSAKDYVIQAEADTETSQDEGDTTGPLIIAEKTTLVQAHSVSDAVMAMDLADTTCLVFRNEATGRLNVVYRRADGNIGWIDPTEV